MVNPEDWTTVELFEYCVLHYIISDEEVFEDWMHNRTDLVQMVKNDIEDN